MPRNSLTYAGVAGVSLATLMYEILLTRIFSVTMWYHFAFMAISIALFGMTVGAVLVYLLPTYKNPEKIHYHLTLNALLFALTIIASFIVHLAIPFNPQFTFSGVFSIIAIYIVIAVPFIFSGICICLALSKFPRDVSKFYAADLFGAALGCIFIIIVLNIIDAPSAVIFTALLASIGAILFCYKTTHTQLLYKVKICSIVLALLLVINVALNAINSNAAPFRLYWDKEGPAPHALYEKWNSFSRITVEGHPNVYSKPFCWGLSPSYPPTNLFKWLLLEIDSLAYTPLVAYHGDPKDADYLKYDLTNIVHYIRPASNVLVIGAGGGRDILSALIFQQKSVRAVEINPNIINVMTKIYGDYTGHLDRDPRVTLVNDEARSYIARLNTTFDIIQLSLIDTWAATAAGAFTLTENSLYTVEAWQSFLNHLTPRGVLTVSRWYSPEQPVEMYRLTVLASTALHRLGITNSRQHVVIIAATQPQRADFSNDRIITLLVSKNGFSAQDIAMLSKIAHDMQFKILLSPQIAVDPILAEITNPLTTEKFINNFSLNITAPTDDNPYFFQTLKFRDIVKQQFWHYGKTDANKKAVLVLAVLLATVIILTLACIIIPLTLTLDHNDIRNTLPLLGYFASIGIGFMLIEISQMQRLIVFLGHPVYGLSVVLFTLLLSSSFGSYLTNNMPSKKLCLSLLIVILILFGFLSPLLIEYFQTSHTIIRIISAFIALFPVGILMGTAFPIGMQLAHIRAPSLTPWLWGVNGATSVCASVLAVILSIAWGITMTFWIGVACYLFALLMLMLKKVSSA